MARPAIRVILAPLQRQAPKGYTLHGTAQQRTIHIDPRHHYPVLTYLHERLHVENPSWSETRVRRETAHRWKRMHWREKAKLLKELAHALVGDVED
jgi:hypothetical protein